MGEWEGVCGRDLSGSESEAVYRVKHRIASTKSAPDQHVHFAEHIALRVWRGM